MCMKYMEEKAENSEPTDFLFIKLMEEEPKTNEKMYDGEMIERANTKYLFKINKTNLKKLKCD